MFFLAYLYVPNAIKTNITATVRAPAEENSSTAGIVGTVMLLSDGAKNACKAHAFEVTLKARVLEVTILTASPDAAGTSQ